MASYTKATDCLMLYEEISLLQLQMKSNSGEGIEKLIEVRNEFSRQYQCILDSEAECSPTAR